MTNKLIEHLAEEVDLLGDFTPTKVPGHYAGTISIDTIEKFAELIVKECADLVIAHEDDAPEEFHKLWLHMKEHFGVK
jgi:hypothetical protein